ncbi:hypothetical protein C8R44DRAFT_764806 [Mycena epipterygia]|nr:hypothetical protein C8R44DRAFT_764806 [Mycena epipterygia]
MRPIKKTTACEASRTICPMYIYCSITLSADRFNVHVCGHGFFLGWGQMPLGWTRGGWRFGVEKGMRYRSRTTPQLFICAYSQCLLTILDVSCPLCSTRSVMCSLWRV